MSPLPCPCCGQMTTSEGVRTNARANARARLYDAEQAVRRVSKSAAAATQNGQAELRRLREERDAAQKALDELEAPE